MAHGDAWRGSEGETGEWSRWPVLFTLPRNMVYPALLPLMRTPRLPVVDWTDAPVDLNGLARFAERRNLVSARVPSHFNWSVRMVVELWAGKECGGSGLTPSLFWGCLGSSSLKTSSWTSWPLTMGPRACPATSVTTNIRCVTSQKSEVLFTPRPKPEIMECPSPNEATILGLAVRDWRTTQRTLVRIADGLIDIQTNTGSLSTCSCYHHPCISYIFVSLPCILVPWGCSVRCFSAKGVLYFNVNRLKRRRI